MVLRSMNRNIYKLAKSKMYHKVALCAIIANLLLSVRTAEVTSAVETFGPSLAKPIKLL